MSEMGIMKDIQVIASKLRKRLFRNNCGMAWMGQPFYPPQEMTVVVNPGDVVIRRARPVRFGLTPGSSDLIGWESVKITPKMVGRSFARFLAVEVKTENGHRTDLQKNFIEIVQAQGGRAFFVSSVEEAKELLKGER